MMKNISNRLKSLREDRDLRQVDVAEKTGIDQRSLSNYETGKTKPDSETIIILADFYGVSCDYLLGVVDTDLHTQKDIINEIKNIQLRLDYICKYLNRQ